MKEIHTYMSVLKCFLDIHSEMKILISELLILFSWKISSMNGSKKILVLADKTHPL